MTVHEFTTGDKPLDTALNALITSAHYDTATALKLADELETKFFDFNKGFSTYLKILRSELDGIAESQAAGIESTYIGGGDAIVKLWWHISTFESDACAILENFHNDRARAIAKSIGVEQNLFQATIDYATRRGLAQTPTDKPSRHSNLAITEKYRADMKTCATESKTT